MGLTQTINIRIVTIFAVIKQSKKKWVFKLTMEPPKKHSVYYPRLTVIFKDLLLTFYQKGFGLSENRRSTFTKTVQIHSTTKQKNGGNL